MYVRFLRKQSRTYDLRGDQFKLGDFGLAEIYRPGLGLQKPLPQALSSPHQNRAFSEKSYEPDDDLYSIGYLMTELQQCLLQWVVHPDQHYRQLCWDLMKKSENCNVEHALRVAEAKYYELT